MPSVPPVPPAAHPSSPASPASPASELSPLPTAAAPSPAPLAPLSPIEAELDTLIRARYPLIYVVSWEERRVEETLREVCKRRGKKMIMWTYTTGMAGNVASRDPLAALDYIMGAPDQSVFVLKDFHPFIGDVAVTRRLRDLVYALKTSYKTLILISPLLKLPPELEKEITVVDYQLPTLGEIDRLMEKHYSKRQVQPGDKHRHDPAGARTGIKSRIGFDLQRSRKRVRQILGGKAQI